MAGPKPDFQPPDWIFAGFSPGNAEMCKQALTALYGWCGEVGREGWPGADSDTHRSSSVGRLDSGRIGMPGAVPGHRAWAFDDRRARVHTHTSRHREWELEMEGARVEAGSGRMGRGGSEKHTHAHTPTRPRTPTRTRIHSRRYTIDPALWAGLPRWEKRLIFALARHQLRADAQAEGESDAPAPAAVAGASPAQHPRRGVAAWRRVNDDAAAAAARGSPPSPPSLAGP